MIIDIDMIKKAIELVRPTAETMLAVPTLTWGPQWVEGNVAAPGVVEIIDFVFGNKKDWNPDWGEEKLFFDEIANRKLILAHRLGKNTSVVIATEPWLLESKEYLYSGGVFRHGISVAVSGAMGRTDECIAEMVASAIIMLANLEADRRKKEGKMQI